jgi:hypothetical protein
MKVFLAIIFFCQGECAFWRGDRVHYTEQDCISYLSFSITKFPNSAGACISVPDSTQI